MGDNDKGWKELNEPGIEEGDDDDGFTSVEILASIGLFAVLTLLIYFEPIMTLIKEVINE